MKRIILLLLILATAISASAQKEAAWWYFGYGQGLDFTKVIAGTSTVPERICDGPLNQTEGVFSISDANGDFLMASDGQKVYGRDRVEMAGTVGPPATPNINHLWGNGTATQSGIVVPFPGSTSKYYIFTSDSREATNQTGVIKKSIAYTLIDMNLGDPINPSDPNSKRRGDLVPGVKNVELVFKSGQGVKGEMYENITAIPHAKGIDYWVIARTKRGFYAWRVTPTGVSTEPTHLAADFGPTSGFPIGGGAGYGGDGHIRASSDGKHIISTIISNSSSGTNQGNVTYVDFDADTGEFSGLKVLAASNRSIYGIEFSPNNKYVYYAESTSNSFTGGVFRMSLDFIKTKGTATLSASNSLNVAVPRDELIYSVTEGNNIQIGPNGWLYMIVYLKNNLNIIKNLEDPIFQNVKVEEHPVFFENCSMHPSKPDSGTGLGLPTFMPSFFYMGEVEADEIVCVNTPAPFSVTAAQGTGGNRAGYLEWNMGDGSPLQYTGLSVDEGGTGWPIGDIHKVSHEYKEVGFYTITITPYKENGGGVIDIEIEPQVIEVSDCVIPVNPHLRGKIVKE